MEMIIIEIEVEGTYEQKGIDIGGEARVNTASAKKIMMNCQIKCNS